MIGSLSNDIRLGEFLGGAHRPLMGVVEVTNRCNMRCPICFSDSRRLGDDIPFEEIRGRMSRLLRISGGPVPLHISGGEPTLREDLPDIVGMARKMGFAHVELISNGIRIGQEPGYLFKLKNVKPRIGQRINQNYRARARAQFTRPNCIRPTGVE